MTSTRFWGIRGMHGVSWKWVRSIGSIDEEEGERGFVDRLLRLEKNRIVQAKFCADRPARD